MHISVLICLFNPSVSQWGESVLSFVIVHTSTSSHHSAEFSFINLKTSSYVSRPLTLFNNHCLTYLYLQTHFLVIFGIICLFEPSLYVENDFWTFCLVFLEVWNGRVSFWGSGVETFHSPSSTESGHRRRKCRTKRSSGQADLQGANV